MPRKSLQEGNRLHVGNMHYDERLGTMPPRPRRNTVGTSDNCAKGYMSSSLYPSELTSALPRRRRGVTTKGRFYSNSNLIAL